MAAKVFISYSHEDEQYKNQLLAHLSLLKHEGLIEPWHDRRIQAGEDFPQKIDGELKKADIIVLLISANFIASNYCHSRELKSAMERHEQKLAKVVPVIVRACDWATAPFGTLRAFPRDGKAITSWANQDEAYSDVAQGIRNLVEKAQAAPDSAPGRPPPQRRPGIMRYVVLGIGVIAVLAGLAYWQLWRTQTQQEPVPPASLLPEQKPNSPKGSDSRSTVMDDEPAGADRPSTGTTAAPTDPIRGNRKSTGEPGRAPASPETDAPRDTVFASEGVIVITEVAATTAMGQAWESGNDLAPLPDVLLCFRQAASGNEICRPNWFGLASARTRAHEDASHAVDVFADMKHWNETFWLALRDQDDFDRKLMGQGQCHFGRPCPISWAGDGKTPIAEVLVLPALQSGEALRTRYLRRCVDGSSLFAQQWEALVAFANPGGAAKPPASQVSYEALARTFMAASDIELTGGMLKAAIEAGNDQGRLGHVANTFRATLLQAEANLNAQSPPATRDAVDRRSSLLRQRLADIGLDRLVAAGCQ